MNITDTRNLIESLFTAGTLNDQTFEAALKAMGHKIPRKPYYEPVPKKEVDVSTLDWDKTDIRIAAEIRKSTHWVSRMRRSFGRPKLSVKHPDIKWRELDWKKNNQQLAGELGVSAQHVNEIRMKLKLPSAPRISRSIISEAMIASVDWKTSQDINISKQWKVSREYVRQIRNERQLPRCEMNCSDPVRSEVEKWLIDNKDSISGMLASKAANLCPVQLEKSAKYKIMRRTKIPFVFRHRREHSALTIPINWEIPNVLLEFVWGKSGNWASNTRTKYSQPKSRFFHTPKLGKLNMFNKEELSALVTEELKKAKSLGVNSNTLKLSEYGFYDSSHTVPITES